MASVVTVIDAEDYESWKESFDADPGGRKQLAVGHRIMRGVDDPNKVFVRTEFRSVDDAREFRDRLFASGVLDTMTLVQEPTVVEVADEATY
jgi:hypothetical protein